ncbi:MAG: hypothetical protein ACRBFS_18835 [Aureispira sp.]
MPRFYLFFSILILLSACSPPTPVASNEAPAIDPLPTVDSIIPDTIVIPAPPSPLTCTCKRSTYKTDPRTQLTFQASQKKSNPQKIEEWANKPALKTIKSLRLMGYDTIPASFAIFKEVTKIVLANVHTKELSGLNMFPKLKELHFFGGQLALNSKEKWTQRIQILAAQKTVFKEAISFKAFPNLEIIDFAFSGFKVFPTGLEQLTCLQELHFNAYINGSQDNLLDLSQFDLALFPCLRKASFMSWQKTMVGTPKGMLADHLQHVTVHHGNLTKEEKVVMNDVKNILANRMGK